MLGSMVTDLLTRDPSLKVTATVRSEALRASMGATYPKADWLVFDPATDAATSLFESTAWAINAIGITKPLIRDDRADEIERAIDINAKLPHRLAHSAARSGARILQIATDCVYSGGKGAYAESDAHDALDVYGKTKSLGETFQDNVHHLRCSIIGPEPKAPKFLIEWFRRQPQGAVVKGFTNHRWNGITTLQFARLCRAVIVGGPALGHMLHVMPSGSLSKAEMLHEFAAVYGRGDISIEDVPAATVVDRTLSTHQSSLNAELWKAAGYAEPPTVAGMIRELAAFDYRAEVA